MVVMMTERVHVNLKETTELVSESEAGAWRPPSLIDLFYHWSKTCWRNWQAQWANTYLLRFKAHTIIAALLPFITFPTIKVWSALYVCSESLVPRVWTGFADPPWWVWNIFKLAGSFVYIFCAFEWLPECTMNVTTPVVLALTQFIAGGWLQHRT